jgi:flagellar biosynthesis/type III secretory pathway chaperone
MSGGVGVEFLLRDLRDLLGQQVDHLKTLEQVLERQKEALVQRDIPAIVDSIEAQEECLKSVQRMEEVRAELMSRISSAMGFGPGGVTLRELTESLDPDVGRELRSTGQTMRDTLENIGRVNRENRNLVEHSLEFVREMLTSISCTGPDRETYESSGTLKPRRQEHLLVDRTT